MGLIASLDEIDECLDSTFIMHEKSEKLIPFHTHLKGQLSFVEGGIAYVTVDSKTYVVPARHFFWIPKGISHILQLGHSATVLRSIYFYVHDDYKDSFYGTFGIYPANELLIQMIQFTEVWDGRNVSPKEENFEFIIALKNILPTMRKATLPIALPITVDSRMLMVIDFLEKNISEQISMAILCEKFNLSERTLARLFQSKLQMSFLQYFKTLRMIRALEMLLKTDLSISEISYAVGYDTLGAFSNTFFSFTQYRPSSLRKKLNH